MFDASGVGMAFRIRADRMKRALAKNATQAKLVEIPPAFVRVVEAFSAEPDVRAEKGWGAGNVVLKLDGKMFAMAVRGDLVVKLPKARVDALVTSSAGKRFDPRKNGRVMKEWIVVPDGGPNWVALAKEGLAFLRATRVG